MLTRREWLRLAGTGAGISVLSRDLETFGLVQTGAARKVTFPRGAVVLSVLKDIPPDRAGWWSDALS
jgi:hypothetical protein